MRSADETADLSRGLAVLFDFNCLKSFNSVGRTQAKLQLPQALLFDADGQTVTTSVDFFPFFVVENIRFFRYIILCISIVDIHTDI